MIPFYESGIRNTTPNRKIDFNELYQLISSGSTHRVLIESIRTLKSHGDIKYYKRYKESLPYITPHVDVHERNLRDDHFTENFICFTGFLYYDIDNVENIIEEKQRIINSYGNQVALVCISPSGAGLTILVRINNELTKDNFLVVWNKVRTTLFRDERIDPNATGIGRAMFVSYDPDVYVNNESVFEIVFEEIGNQPNTSSSLYNSLNSDIKNNNYKNYHVYSIDDVLSTIKTKSIVPVSNPVVDFKEVEVLEEIRFLQKITDGNKHSAFFRVINQLYYLNQDVELDYIYSYLFFINNIWTIGKMDTIELVRYFNIIISHIKHTGEFYIQKKLKRVHFNPSVDISAKEKMVISNVLNGLYRRWETKKKIDDTIELLKGQGKKPTNRVIAEILDMSVDTIGDRRRDPPIDMDYEVSLFN